MFQQLLNAPSCGGKQEKRQQIYESWKFCNFCYNQDHKHFLFPAKFSSMNSKEKKKTKLFFLPISIHTYKTFSQPSMHTEKKNTFLYDCIVWLWRDMNVHVERRGKKNKQQEMLSLYERLLVVKSIESYYGKS